MKKFRRIKGKYLTDREVCDLLWKAELQGICRELPKPLLQKIQRGQRVFRDRSLRKLSSTDRAFLKKALASGQVWWQKAVQEAADLELHYRSRPTTFAVH